MKKSFALENCVNVKLFSEINPLQLNNAKLQNQGEMGQGTLPRCRGTALSYNVRRRFFIRHGTHSPTP